jgi:hypothetical protein
LCLNQKYLIGVTIKDSESSRTCGLSKALLYSSVNIDEAQIKLCTQSFALVLFFELTSTLIEIKNDGCAADSHITF